MNSFGKFPTISEESHPFFVTPAYCQVIDTSTTCRPAAGCTFIHVLFASKVSLFKLTASLASYYFLPLP